MAEVQGARSSSSAGGRPQLWRPANEVLKFLTECALPPPQLSLALEFCAAPQPPSSAKPPPFNAKRQPPARWEPPAQMRAVLVPDQCVHDHHRREARHRVVGSGGSLESVPRSSVDSNSVGARSEGSAHTAASPDRSPPHAPRSPGIDVWQFPRPSVTSISKSADFGQFAQSLPPQNRTVEQSRLAVMSEGEARNGGKGALPGAEAPSSLGIIPKSANAFARAACDQSSGWGSPSPIQTTIRSSGFETCAAKKNSFEAFASAARGDVGGKEKQPAFCVEQKGVRGLKSNNLGTSASTAMDANASSCSAELQPKAADSQIEGQTENQVQAMNSESENGSPAAIDLLVNAVQVASGKPSVAVDKGMDCNKVVVSTNAKSNCSSKEQKISFFLHGHVPFKRKKVTRRAKSAFPKAFKDKSRSVASSFVYSGIPQCQQIYANESSGEMPHKKADSMRDSKIPIHRRKNEKQTPQAHKSLQAILFGDDSPTVKLTSGRTKLLSPQYHDSMISASTKKSRSKIFRRSDTLRLDI